MYITIEQNGLSLTNGGGTVYRRIKSLAFDPEAGVLGQSAAINEFTAEVATGDDIAAGDYIRLYDDQDRLWARYWLVSARRQDRETVRLTGKSDLWLLERPTLPATYYDGARVSDLVREIFDSVGYTFGGAPYALDPALANETLTGFCPEQTARARLLWVCFAAGAYIQSCFCEGLRILPVPAEGDPPALVPPERIFYKPRILRGDYVTAVAARGYRFSRREPLAGEKYVADQAGVTYVYESEDVAVENPERQGGQFPVNVVTAADVMLLDPVRAARAAARLARHCFNRVTLELDVLDNGAYLPGQRVTVHGGSGALYTGIVTACRFRFGVQARATITVAAAQSVESAALNVVDRLGAEVLGVRRYTFPVGYGYAVANDFIDLARNGARRVLRPLADCVEGAVAPGENTAFADYAVALELRDGVLEIVSVDGVDGGGGIG